jgi:hypothetical protein
MEQIIITVNSDDTASAIKKFIDRFEDATIEKKDSHDNEYYLNTYGINKAELEKQLNIGIAQSLLGIIKSWDETRQKLLSKIAKGGKH